MLVVTANSSAGVPATGGDRSWEGPLKFGTFIFPTLPNAADDAQGIQEALHEARLSEQLGMDALWLAEHHFDGNCVYVDPITFAAGLAMATTRVQIGFAVIQASLYHPLRLAEQLTLLDHLSGGRVIAGLGKGSTFNTYEYEAYEIDPAEASARLAEIEDILLKCWTQEGVEHHGKFWNFKIPMLRPRPFTQPHPPLLRAASSDESTIAQARAGRPFLMAGPNAVIRKRVELIRKTMHEAGYSEAKIADTLKQSWAWKNVVLAETDAEAIDIGADAFQRYLDYREKLGLGTTFMEQYRPTGGSRVPRGYLFGSPATVLEELAEVPTLGIGGLLLRFRIGPMPVEEGLNSLRLFVDKIAPHLRAKTAQAKPIAAHAPA